MYYRGRVKRKIIISIWRRGLHKSVYSTWHAQGKYETSNEFHKLTVFRLSAIDTQTLEASG